MTAIDEAEVIARYRDGERNRSKIAQAVGCSRSKVDRVLTDAGIDLCPPGFTTEQRWEMAASYQAGATLAGLSRVWNLSTSTVSLILRSSGVTMRPQGRRRGSRQVNELTPGQVLDSYERGGIRELAAALNSSISTAYRTYRATLNDYLGGPAAAASPAPACAEHADLPVDPCLVEAL